MMVNLLHSCDEPPTEATLRPAREVRYEVCPGIRNWLLYRARGDHREWVASFDRQADAELCREAMSETGW